VNAVGVVSTITTILVVISAIVATSFVVAYHFTSRWWRTEVGRNLQAYMFISAGLLDLGVVRAVTNSSPDAGWFIYLRLVFFSAVPIVIGWRLWILIKLQILAHHNGRDSLDPAYFPDTTSTLQDQDQDDSHE